MSLKMVLDETAVDSLRRIMYAAAKTDRWRPQLCSIRFDGDAAFATDGYRMAVAYFDGEPADSVLLSAADLRKALPKRGDWVPNGIVPMEPKQLPELRKFLNRCRWEWAVRYDRAELLAFARQAIAGREKSDRTPLIGLGNGEVKRKVLVHYGDERGWTEETETVSLEREGIGYPLGTVWVNARFLRDALIAATPDSVLLEFDDPLKPVMLREPGRTHLIMPVRVA